MLKIRKIDKENLKEKIQSVYCSNNIYIGLGNKLVDYNAQKILAIHEKSIRCISGNEKFIGCCSYDGTASIFDTNGQFIDKIEGPDTEIKGIAFDGNFIALTTRGKTTWILENLEISKILDDHTQDVKGCAFDKNRLYTWSYDGTIKVYDLFKIDHSWELSQSIDCEEIVWNVLFYKDYLIACLNNGNIIVFTKPEYLWIHSKTIKISMTPVYSGCIVNEHMCFICNRSSLLFLDSNFENVCEAPEMNSGCDAFCCSFSKTENAVFVGSEDGSLAIIRL